MAAERLCMSAGSVGFSRVCRVSMAWGHIGQQQQPGAPVCVIYHGELEGRGGKKKQKYFTEYC